MNNTEYQSKPVPLAAPSKQSKSILLADDDASVREILTRVLSSEGYNVWPAVNGLEAIKIAQTTPIDLVLLDLNMPGLDGWSTFIRLTNENPKLPVIIITAKPNQMFTALASGAGALLEKPLDFPRLLQIITSLLAESIESRRSRIEGGSADFYYLPTPIKE